MNPLQHFSRKIFGAPLAKMMYSSLTGFQQARPNATMPCSMCLTEIYRKSHGGRVPYGLPGRSMKIRISILLQPT